MDSFLRLKKNNDTLVLDIFGDEINSLEFDIHLRSIKTMRKFKKMLVNLEYLSDINNESINKFLKMRAFLSDKIISFINVKPMQNVILNLFGMDKIFQIYITKADAQEGKNPVVNRNFKVV